MCNILRLGTLAWIGFVFFYETHQGSSGLEENFQQQKSEACGKTNPLIHLLAPNNFQAACVCVCSRFDTTDQAKEEKSNENKQLTRIYRSINIRFVYMFCPPPLFRA